ncbi:MAG: type II toxin-antitoxin system HicA family toxin [Chloroflexi bacterium]|nr:type II toxin-antitoxin system HicA family toxin [Chloroflexota bacterium]
MAAYSYDDMRHVLGKLGFQLVRARKHETWEKVLENKAVLQVRLSHHGKRDIPKGTFHEMLRQAGVDEKTFKTKLAE